MDALIAGILPYTVPRDHAQDVSLLLLKMKKKSLKPMVITMSSPSRVEVALEGAIGLFVKMMNMV